MRVLVTGSRDWPDYEIVWNELYAVLGEFGDFTLVHGDCPSGVDNQADAWSYEVMLENVERHPANWKGPRKKGAGFARNAEMVELGADLCLAFIHNESEGATHCSELAEKAGIETRIFRSESRMPMIESKLTPRPYKRVRDELKLEGVRLIWRNFAGEKKLYNEDGKRKFAIPLEEDLALELYDAGWNVKDNINKINDGKADEILYHLDVTVKMDGRVPPRMFMVAKKWSEKDQGQISVRTLVDDEDVPASVLDFAPIDYADVILRPFNWDVNGKQGVSGYLKTLFAFLRVDDLEAKYAHIPIEGPEQPEIEAGDDILDVESGEWIEEEDSFNYDQKALERGRS